MLTVDQALEKILAGAQPISCAETLPIDQALGRTLAQDQHSAIHVPPADNSAMDGYACRAADIAGGGVYEVSQRIAAGEIGEPHRPGTLARIFTGAPIPAGADAVVIQEDTAPEGNNVRVETAPVPGENVRPAGQDIVAGTVVAKAGRLLSPAKNFSEISNWRVNLRYNNAKGLSPSA